jgi:tRNA(Ile)-lysidine synthase
MKNDLYLLYKINNAIVERNLLKPNQKILIAVSGGQDSICLVRILFQLKQKWNWEVGIIHCDHRWNSSSKFQAKHVMNLAARLKVDYYEGITVGPVKTEGMSRIWRYGIIQTVAISNNYTAIVTGHSASDRIETLLYNLIRGSGLHGLQSIRWKRYFCSSLLSHSPLSTNHPPLLFKALKYRKSFDNFSFLKKKNFCLTRPLMETTRTEIRSLLNFCNFPLWRDETNQEVRISRNRIRHRLIPYLKFHYNLNIDQTLARWTEIVQAETFCLEQVANYLLIKIKIIKKNYLVTQKLREGTYEQTFHFYQSAISLDLLRSLPTALQRRILKQHIYKITGRNLGFQSIEEIRLSCLFHNFLSKSFSDHFHNQKNSLVLRWEKKTQIKKKKISTHGLSFQVV